MQKTPTFLFIGNCLSELTFGFSSSSSVPNRGGTAWCWSQNQAVCSPILAFSLILVFNSPIAKCRSTGLPPCIPLFCSHHGLSFSILLKVRLFPSSWGITDPLTCWFASRFNGLPLTVLYHRVYPHQLERLSKFSQKWVKAISQYLF